MRTAFGKCLAMAAVATILALAATTGDAWAQLTGILATKHNLSTGSTQSIHTTDAASKGEVCVFCHTPHGADTTVSAPLWNRAMPTTTGYQMYTSPTYDATTDANPTGVSLACLSCHDGTIAFDALRNLPGSGGFSETPTSAGWAFVGAAPGNLMPNGITNLGKDLRNDHPISMVYSSALSPSATSGTNTHLTGFKQPDAQGVFANGVRLYETKVQCASCHDPHRSDTPTFLRVSNDASALCLTCHKKDG